jgi:hypothetical protein
MPLDHISARMTYGTTINTKHISAVVAHTMQCENNFGILAYSKQHTFIILLILKEFSN